MAGADCGRCGARPQWSRERYETGQRSLMDVMHVIGATSPDRAVLRPSLREEARKVVGDTGEVSSGWHILCMVGTLTHRVSGLLGGHARRLHVTPRGSARSQVFWTTCCVTCPTAA